MTTDAVLPSFIQSLLKPEKYPHPVENVELVQTHISFVLLAGDYVYKFKKPVNFGFLDFSDLEKRHFCCDQELLLNRRLCPDIYLDIVEVHQQGQEFFLDGQGKLIEYGVRMKRMPEESMMANLIRSGSLSEKHVDAIVDVLVPFYAQAEHGKEVSVFGTAEAVAVNILENFEQTRAFIGQEALSKEQFNTISKSAHNFLGQTELFAERQAAGHICDCHGDLYSANICLADRVYIYDCIEFNQRFRYCDVASDVAFLAMDLDYHGLTQLSTYFIDRFVAASKDPGLLEMLNFYKGYRAYVRGKIGLFTASDPAVDAQFRTQCIDDATRYFRLAEQYATN